MCADSEMLTNHFALVSHEAENKVLCPQLNIQIKMRMVRLF